MEVDVPVPDCGWQGDAVEGKVANEDEDVVLCGAPEGGRGEEGGGTPNAGEDGREGCFSAERSIERIIKIFIFACQVGDSNMKYYIITIYPT